ncbi:hypothetical protein TWF225_006814 [Orbilia oligospora]|nr:hypothetical protein TWF751_008448 [Orbilia oligospora]KAF3194259.1 hypothetical protein TWF225_006814 [Orbilia oligospora]KAF3238570.1 hypothetical protein TWF217_001688 [Orbilia oligospora]KAF3240753.1 hypothetical protein TWF128_011179 [Orbilia oligospora]
MSQKEESINKKKKVKSFKFSQSVTRKEVRRGTENWQSEIVASVPELFSGIFSKSCLLYIRLVLVIPYLYMMFPGSETPPNRRGKQREPPKSDSFQTQGYRREV